MATVLHNTAQARDSDTGVGLGLILAIILVVALGIVLFAFGIPALQGEIQNNNATLKVVPETSTNTLYQ